MTETQPRIISKVMKRPSTKGSYCVSKPIQTTRIAHLKLIVITKGNVWQGCTYFYWRNEREDQFSHTPSMKSYVCLNDEHLPNTFEKYP